MPGDEVWVDGDSTRLEQIFTNLLSNANKYTPEGGQIELGLRTVEIEGGRRQAVVRVTDNGDGIDADLVPHLFQLFTQADRSLAHSHGSLGLLAGFDVRSWMWACRTSAATTSRGGFGKCRSRELALITTLPNQ